MKLGSKFERNRAIRGGVIAISVFDLMTLNAVVVVLSSWIIFTKFDLRQLIRAWIVAFFDAGTLCHAVTLTFDLLTLNFGYHAFKLSTKFGELKTQDLETRHQTAGLENARKGMYGRPNGVLHM